jgi:hypothetical protein
MRSLLAACVLVPLLGLAAQNIIKAPRPLTAQPSMEVPTENLVSLFKDAGFSKPIGYIDIAQFAPSAFHKMPQGASDSVSSMRWNLPDGAVIVFYENGATTTNKGRQYVIFGNGQDNKLSDNDFENCVSTWCWYKVD